MKKPIRPPDSSSPHPREEQADLWKNVAATIEPLRKGKSRVRHGEPPVTASQGGTPKPVHAAHPAEHTPAAPVYRGAQHVLPSPAGLDRKTVRKLGSGRLEIDARIDLHGMRQNEAHTALRRFLFASYERGARLVLVITGKGVPAGQREDSLGNWSESGRERGVLRRNVPTWLEEPELRAIVISFSGAAVRHGGDGALYVHLRRNVKRDTPL
jgi:DNA-nicking Smr family endonuclease